MFELFVAVAFALSVFLLYLVIRFLIIVPNALREIANAVTYKVLLDDDDGSDDD